MRREAKLVDEAQDLSKLLTGVSVTIAQKAGEADQLFGSVTSKDIAEALALPLAALVALTRWLPAAEGAV